jgi:hypothetical protein
MAACVKHSMQGVLMAWRFAMSQRKPQTTNPLVDQKFNLIDLFNI